METTIEFRQAVSEVLVEMAIDDNFPLDLNELCIDTVFESANAKLQGDAVYQRLLLGRKLGVFLTGDADLETNLCTWEKLTSDHDKDLAEDHLDMWGGLSGSMTIKELSHQIE